MKKTFVKGFSISKADCELMISIFKKELENGWSSSLARKKAGITTKVDIYLELNYEEYVKLKYLHNINLRRINKVSYEYLNKRIDVVKERLAEEQRRIKTIEQSILPVGKMNLKGLYG
jgi:hypothetical protein